MPENWIVIHVAVTMLYVLIRARAQQGQAFCEFFIVLLIPGLGLAFLLTTLLIRRFGFREDPAYMYDSFHNNRPLFRDYSRREANIIPLEDVLALEDAQTKRLLMGEVIRRNALHNNELLFKAVKDADSEVSHYAVSVASGRIEEMEAALSRLGKELGQNPTDSDILVQYVKIMGAYLKLGFLDEVSQRKFTTAYAEALATLISHAAPDKEQFTAKIDCELALGNYDEAAQFCESFMSVFPRQEEPYLMYIKLYYLQQDAENLHAVICRLKDTDIRFTNRALQSIRFWERGEQYA